ncbi:hypothetical protein [Streptomyces sp. ODS05-4]|uniref:hypothetical protein n=1 Tax=Streptomyces sp. ODS05-4 TaxID=2944939 RepID=UPI00210BB1E4|nr:hypothetical protein [Streptomyces sp. ODS05-4]
MAALGAFSVSPMMTSPAVADSSESYTKTNISRVVGPGEKGRVAVNCGGGTKYRATSVSAMASGSSVSFPPSSFNPKSSLKLTNLQVEGTKDTILEFENTASKNVKPKFRVSFWVTLTITCSANSTTPVSEFMIEDSIMLPGATVFGDGTGVGILTCPKNFPIYESSSAEVENGVTYKKSFDYSNPDSVTFEFANTLPADHLDFSTNVNMRLTCRLTH